jgi:hypothetical protein
MKIIETSLGSGEKKKIPEEDYVERKLRKIYSLG